MDPNENLRQQMILAGAILSEDCDESAAPDLAELVIAMNGWLRKGGFLPNAWKSGIPDPSREPPKSEGPNGDLESVIRASINGGPFEKVILKGIVGNAVKVLATNTAGGRESVVIRMVTLQSVHPDDRDLVRKIMENENNPQFFFDDEDSTPLEPTAPPPPLEPPTQPELK